MNKELKINIEQKSSTSEDTPEEFYEDNVKTPTTPILTRSPTHELTQEPTHEEYKNHINDFRKYLESDWKRWSVMQIKQAMVQGLRTIHLMDMKSKDYIYGKNIKNCWKINPVVGDDLKYYHKKSNILITGKWVRDVIDFITDIGMEWVPESNERYENIAVKYNKLFIKIPYTSTRDINARYQREISK